MPSTKTKYEPSKKVFTGLRQLAQGFGWVYAMSTLAAKHNPKNPIQPAIVGKITLYEGGILTVRGHRLGVKKMPKPYNNTVDVTASLATHRIHWADPK